MRILNYLARFSKDPFLVVRRLRPLYTKGLLILLNKAVAFFENFFEIPE